MAEHLHATPPAVLVRLAGGYAAAARGCGWVGTSWWGPLEWLEPLLEEALDLDRGRAHGRLRADLVESLLSKPAELYRVYLSLPPGYAEVLLGGLEGIGERLAFHAPVLEHALQKDTKRALELMRRHQVPVEPFVVRVVRLAVNGARGIRL